MLKNSNCGVYKITNIRLDKEEAINDKVYVGSSVNIKSRKYAHYYGLSKNKHPNRHLQRSYNILKELWGEDTGRTLFKWEVIEYVNYSEDKEQLKKELLEKEQYWIDFYDSSNYSKGYNMNPTAGSTLGFKDSEETKKKKSDSNKGKHPMSKEHKERIRESNKGKIFTEEHKKKLSLSHEGRLKGKEHPRYGKKHTAETKEKIRRAKEGHIPSEACWEKAKEVNTGRKMSDYNKGKLSEANKGRKMSEYVREKLREAPRKCKKRVINLTTDKIFSSIKEAEEFYSTSHVGEVCKGTRETAGGFRWSFTEGGKLHE